jgi:hypothetical protein
LSSNVFILMMILSETKIKLHILQDGELILVIILLLLLIFHILVFKLQGLINI